MGRSRNERKKPKSKSKPKPKPPSRLSRSQVLTKYGISFKTYEALRKGNFLKGPVTYGSGKEFIEASEHNDFVLKSARNDIYSFGNGLRGHSGGHGGGITVPFHRFLLLRFMNTPAAETLEEMIQIGLIHPDTRFRRTEINRYYSRFVDRLPESLKKAIIAGNEPVKPDLKKQFHTMLKVLGIDAYYDHPEMIDQISFLVKAKGTIEPILSTTSSADDVAELCCRLLHAPGRVTVEAIVAYRALFYAIHELPKHDLSAYKGIIPPDEKRSKAAAFGQTLTEYGARKGIDQAADTRAILETIKKDAQRAYLKHSQWAQTDQGLQAMRAHLDTFFKACDRLETLGGTGSSAVAKMFEKFVVDAVDDDSDIDLSTIPAQTVQMIEDKEKPKDKS